MIEILISGDTGTDHAARRVAEALHSVVEVQHGTGFRVQRPVKAFRRLLSQKAVDEHLTEVLTQTI